MYDNSLGMCGKMGKVIALYQLYDRTEEEEWKEQADAILDSLVSASIYPFPFDYSFGLIGMGVGFEWLIRKGFIDACPDLLLKEIDEVLIRIIVFRPQIPTNIKNGLLGIGYYLYTRLVYRKNENTPKVLTLKENVLYYIDWLGETLQNASIDKNYYEYYFILVLLHQLNIYNAKIINLLAFCEKCITENNYKRHG